MAKAKPAPPADEAILNAAMAAIAEDGWSRLRLSDLAATAGLPLDAVYRVLPTRWHLLALLARQVDLAMLEDGPADGETAREKLFDLIMRRFDALEPYKSALRRMLRPGGLDPLALATVLPGAALSAGWTLEAAGISTDGVLGQARIAALCAAQASILRTWLGDDSPDLASTMRALDKALGRLESLEMSRPGRAGGKRKGSTEAPQETP